MEQWRELKTHAEQKGLVFLCSPFSAEAVETLEKLGVTQYKIPSGEVTNVPMLELIASTGKPVLLSSGMSSWVELDAAVNTILRQHNRLTVLQCTSDYPCPYEQVGLNVMLEMKERYGLPVGLSDHTLSIYAPLAATALGASAIEKHFTLSRRMYGSDAKHSLEPHELTDMVRGVRAVETMLSNPVSKDSIEGFRVMKKTFEKSLVSLVEIPAGSVLTSEMVGIKKPGTGLSAWRYREVLGRRTARPVPEHQVLQEEDIDWS